MIKQNNQPSRNSPLRLRVSWASGLQMGPYYHVTPNLSQEATKREGASFGLESVDFGLVS